MQRQSFLNINLYTLVVMGYMGLGMQRWIYNRKIRRPFQKSKNRGGYETLETRTWDFKLSGHVSKQKGISNEEFEGLRKKFRSKAYNESVMTLSIIFLVIMFSSYIVYKTPFFSGEPERERIQRVRNQPIEAQKHAIRILMITGMNHLYYNDTEGAIREFSHILTLEPDHQEARIKLLLAFMVDCELNNMNCNEALYLYKHLTSKEKKIMPVELAEKLELLELMNNDKP